MKNRQYDRDRKKGFAKIKELEWQERQCRDRIREEDRGKDDEGHRYKIEAGGGGKGHKKTYGDVGVKIDGPRVWGREGGRKGVTEVGDT